MPREAANIIAPVGKVDHLGRNLQIFPQPLSWRLPEWSRSSFLPGFPLFKRLIPDPFLLVLIGTLLLATFLPAQGGFAVAVGWLANATVVMLFFFHGAKLARSAVIAGLTHWRMHLLIMACTFVMFPVLGLVLSKLVPGFMSPALWTGVLFLVALPSTVQSSIAFVSIANGNVPGAIAAASASQVLGVLLTPLIVGLLSGAHGNASPVAGIGKVAALILLPFIVGQLLRPWLEGFVLRYKSVIALTDRATIIIAVYSAFSAAVIEGIWSRLPADQFARLFARWQSCSVSGATTKSSSCSAAPRNPWCRGYRWHGYCFPALTSG